MERRKNQQVWKCSSIGGLTCARLRDIFVKLDMHLETLFNIKLLITLISTFIIIRLGVLLEIQ